MTKVFLLVFVCFISNSYSQEKILTIPAGDIPIENFLYKADADGYVCFVVSGSNGGTKKSKSSLYLVKEDSVLKVYSGLDRLTIWSIASTPDAFMVLVMNTSKKFELFTVHKQTGVLRKKEIPGLDEMMKRPLSCLTDGGIFYVIQYEKVKKERAFIVATIDSAGRIQTKRFENKIPLIDEKLVVIPSLTAIESDRRPSMIECAAQKKFIKKGNLIHFFIEGYNYNLNEFYDITEVFTMDMESGETTFRTIPDEKILGTANTNSLLLDQHLYRLTIYRDYIELKVYDFESGTLKVSYEISDKEKISIKNSPIYFKNEKRIEVEEKLESTKKLLSRIAGGYGFLFTDFSNDSIVNFKIGAYDPGKSIGINFFSPTVGIAGSFVISVAATLLANAIAADTFGYTYFNASLNANDFSPLPTEQTPPIVKQLDALEHRLRNSGNKISELIQYSTGNKNYVTFYNRLTKSVEVYRLD